MLRPCRTIPWFCNSGLHFVRDGRYFEVDQNYYVTRNYGKRPFGNIIRNYVYYQLSRDFAAIPPGMKGVSSTGIPVIYEGLYMIRVYWTKILDEVT